jgi:mucin-19
MYLFHLQQSLHVYQKQRQYRYYLKNEMFSGIGNDACSSGMSALTQYVVRNCAPSVGSSSEGFLYKTDLFEALDCGFDNPTMSVYTSSSCTPTSKIFSTSLPFQKGCVNGALQSCERGSPPIPTSGKVIDTFNSNDCSGTIIVSSHVTSMQNIYTLCDTVAKLSYTCGLDGSIIRKSHVSGTTCTSFENQYFVAGVGVDTLADTSVCVSQQGFESSNRLTCRPFEPQVFIAGSDECVSEATVQSQTPGILLPLHLGICKLYSPNTAYKLYNCDENGADIAIYKSVGASRGFEVTNCEGIATDSLRLYVNDKTNQFHPNFGVCDVSGKFENKKVQLAALNCPAMSSSGVMKLISDGFFFKDKTPCAIGSYSSSIFGEIQCILCPAGTYSSTIGSSTCIPCNPGTYSTTVGATSSSVCAQCAAGSYSKAYGSISCSSCIGSYSSTSGSSSCILCSAGYYSSTVGATSSSTCVSCPSNTYSYAGSSSCSSCPSGTTYISSSLGCKPSSTTSVGPIDTSFYLSGIDSEGISAFSSTTSSMSGITYSTSSSSYPSSAIIVSSGSYLSTSLLSTLPTDSSPFTISSWVKCDASSLSDVNPSSVVVAWGNIGEMSTSTSRTAASLAVTSKERAIPLVSVSTYMSSIYSVNGFAIDSIGNIYGNMFVSDWSFICKITPSGVKIIFAGGSYGFSDGIGTNARFNNPQGLAVDSSDNIYVADSQNYRIRKITLSGSVTTVAGNGQSGFFDGTGTSASFSYPRHLVIDTSGIIYLSDSNRIRKILPSGSVTTLAGSSYGFADGIGTNAMFGSLQGLVVDASGTIYAADNHRIRKITSSGVVTTLAGSGTSGFADGVGSNALFYFPVGLVVDNLKNVYITDNQNHRIRKITPAGVVTTIAGDGVQGSSDGIGTSAQFSYPNMMTRDSAGNLYVNFVYSDVIRKITISPSLPGPLPVCDSTWHHIMLTYSGSTFTNRLTAYVDGSSIASTTGTYSISSSTSSTSSSLHIGTNGNIINSEYFTGSISDVRIYSRALSSNEIMSLSQPYLASYDNAINPSPIASSNVYTWYCISGYYGPIVTLSRSSSDGSWSSSSGSVNCQACSAGTYSLAGSISCSSCIGSYSSTSGSSSCILCSAGYYSSTVGATSSSTCVSCPSNTYSYAGSSSCSSCPSGTTYISSSLGCKPSSTTSVGPIDTSFYLSGIDSEGISAFSSTTSSMSGITYSTSTSSYPSSAIIVSSGSYLSTSLLSTLPTGSSPFTISSWVKCDASSLSDLNPSSVVIAWGNIGDMSTSTSLTAASLAVTSKERAIPLVSVSTYMSSIYYNVNGIAVDSIGNVYVSDYYSICKITSSGVNTLFAGSSNYNTGFADGIGTNARFNNPQGLAVDSSDNIYVADTNNYRIRKISPSGSVTTIAGSSFQHSPFLSNGDGTGTNAQFSSLKGISVDSSGYIYVTDDNRIRKITFSVVTTLSGLDYGGFGSGTSGFIDGTGTNARFNRPQGIFVDASETIYVADTDNHCIRKITSSGVVTTLAGSGTSGFADGVGTNAKFSSPTAISIHSSGYLFVLDSNNKCIRMISSSGNVMTLTDKGFETLTDKSKSNSLIKQPQKMTIDSSGSTLYIYDTFISSKVLKVTLNLGPLPVCDSTWHHISLTYSGSSSTNILNAYVDGSFIGNILSTYSISSTTSSTSLRIGMNGNIINSEYFTGSISDIRIYSRALSSNEIMSLSQPYLASYDNAINPSPIASSNVYTWYCISGYYGPIVTLSRSSSDGSWSSSSGSVNCQACSAGTYSLAGSISCSSCIGSYSSTSGSSSCILCSAGYYSSTVGATSSSTCVSCPSNTYSYAGSSSCSSCPSGTTYISSSLGCKPSSTTSVGPIDTSFYLSGIDSEGISAFSSTSSSMSGITYSTSSSSYPSSAIIVSSGSYLSTSLLSTLPTGSSPFTISSWVKCDASSLSDLNPSSVVIAWGNIGEMSTSTSRTAASLAVTSKERAIPLVSVSTYMSSIYYNVNGIAVDSIGNVYVSDYYSICKITSSGVSTVFAGSSNYNTGFADGIGTNARFNNPQGLAVDSSDNIYVADSQNYRIRKISPSGSVTTIAGNGQSGFFDGIGTNAKFSYQSYLFIDTSGIIYVSDSNRIRKILPSGSVTTLAGNSYGFADGIGTNAMFSSLQGLVVDTSGTIYAADNHRIRKITSSGVVTTLAGSGTSGFADGVGSNAKFYFPVGLVVDNIGNVYIADYQNHRIRKVTPSGFVSTIAGDEVQGSSDGIGTNAQFSYPRSITRDSAGNIFISESNYGRIRKLIFSLSLPGPLPVCDSTWHHISLSYSGSTSTNRLTAYVDGSSIASTTGTYSISSTTSSTSSLHIGTNGNMINSEYFSGSISDVRIYSRALSSSEIVMASQPRPMQYSMSLSLSPVTPYTWYCASGYYGSTQITLTRSSSDGSWSSSSGSVNCQACSAGTYSLAGSISCSSCIGSYSSTSGSSSCILCSAGYYSSTVGATSSSTCVSCPSNTYSYAGSSSCSSCPSGTTYISSSLGCKPSSTTSVGPIDTSFYLSGIDSESISAFSSTTSSMSGITYSSSSSSYPSSAIIVSSGSYLSTSLLSTLPTGSSPFTISSWVKCDASSLSDLNPSSVVIAWGNIGEMSTSTSLTAASLAVTSIERAIPFVSVSTYLGSISIWNLNGFTIDSSGNVYVSDYYSIRKYTSSGMNILISGSSISSTGFADGIGTNARFNNPQGLAVDSSDNIYVADTSNYRIRKITPSGSVTTIAGNGQSGSADGIGTNARFSNLQGIAVDSSGNVYVTDSGRIRIITSAGDVTTLAGSVWHGFADGEGTNAMFQYPQGIAVDAQGSVYVADSMNYCIRKITSSGIVTTLAGSRTSGFVDGIGTNARFSWPVGVVINLSGNLFVSESNKIRMISSSGDVKTLSKLGFEYMTDILRANSFISTQKWIILDMSGNLFISETSAYGYSNILLISFNLAPFPVCDSTWHHISLTYSGSSSTNILTAYVDEKLLGNILSTYSISSSTSSTSSLRIGMNGNIINSEYFTGSISDVRIYSRALSSNEIMSLSQPYLASYDNAINPSPIASSNVYTWYCISGYYGPIVTLSRSSSDGSWSSSSGSVNCQACSAGTYSLAGSISCSSCIGSYSSTSGSSSCILCSAGYYSSTVCATSSSTCVSCPSNTYSYAGSSSCSSCPSGTTYISSSLGCKPSSTTSVGPIDTSFYLSGIDSESISAFSSTTSSMSGITYSSSSSSYPSSAIIVSSGSYLSTSLLSTLPTGSSPFTISSWVKCDASSLSDLNPSSVVIAWGNIGEMSTSTSLTAASLAVTSKARVNMIATVSTYMSSISSENGFAIDSIGNIYVSDWHSIRKYTSSGVYTLFAGSTNGNTGFADGIGTNAMFTYAQGIAVDSSDNIYVADQYNNRIRMITPSGSVTTVAGNGYGFVDGIGTSASFSHPRYLVIDTSGIIYVSDSNGIRKISSSGSVTTISASGFSSSNIAVDGGSVYVVDTYNHCIRKITSSGVVITLAGSAVAGFADGIGTNAKFYNPTGIVFDLFGNLIIADTNNHRIRKITPSGVVSTLAGSGTSGFADGVGTNAQFSYPRSIARDSFGSIYIIDSYNYRIRKLTFSPSLPGPLPVCDSTWHHISLSYSGSSSTNILTAYVDGSFIGNILSTYSITSSTSSTSSLRIGMNGNMINSEYFIGSISDIRIYSRALSSNEIVMVSQPRPMQYSMSLSLSPVTPYTWHCASGYYGSTQITLTRSSSDGSWSSTSGSILDCQACASNSYNYYTSAISCSTCPSGSTLVSPSLGCRPTSSSGPIDTSFYLSGIDSEGISAFSSTTSSMSGITYSTSSSSYPSSALILSSGSYLSTSLLSTLPTGSSPFTISSWVKCDASSLSDLNPSSVVIAWGNIGDMLTSTSLTAASLAVTSKARVNMIATVSLFLSSSVNDIAVDSSGNILKSDSSSIRKISSSGSVILIAGSSNGEQGFADGIGTNALFYYAQALDVDSTGNIYVADTYNVRIRKISPTGSVTTLAGDGNNGFVDGIGTNARFFYPYGLAVDISGNVYVADTHNNLIRKITPSGVVSTLAGSGSSGLTDGIGTNAKFYNPKGIAVNTEGDVFVADYINNCVRKVTPSGVVTTLAGSGTEGYTDGIGTNAKFYRPSGVTVDLSGNIIVADPHNNRIRKITPLGVVTTIAGDGTDGFTNGIGTNTQFSLPSTVTSDLSGNVYVSEPSSNRIRKLTFSPSLPGPLPVCDSTWHHISLTYSGSSSTNILTAYVDGSSIASTTGTYSITSSTSSSSSLRIGTNGNMINSEYFIGSISDIRIYSRALSSNEIVSLSRPLPQPYTIGSVESPVTPYIWYCSSGYYKTSSSSTQITLTRSSSDGSWSSTSGSILDCQACAANSYNYYTSATSCSTCPSGSTLVSPSLGCRPTSSSGPIDTSFYLSGIDSEGISAFSSTTSSMSGITYSTSSSSYPSSAITVSSGSYLSTSLLSTLPTDSSPFTISSWVKCDASSLSDLNPSSVVIAWGNIGDMSTSTSLTAASLAVTSKARVNMIATVSTLAGSGTVGYADGIGTNAEFSAYIQDVDIDTSGNIYVSDCNGQRVRKISPSGFVTTIAGSGTSTNADGISGYTDGTGTNALFTCPSGIAVDASGVIYVVDQYNYRIRKITPSGVVSTLAGSGIESFANGVGTNAHFNEPNGIAVDSSGNVYIGDMGNNLLRKITPLGEVSTLAGGFNSPRFIAVDASSNVYVADCFNHRICKVSSTGDVTTLAGSGTAGFSDGVGTNAQFNAPQGVAVDSFGNVFVTDVYNYRIRKITQVGVVTTIAGSGVQGFSDGPGTSSKFHSLVGIFVNAAGDLYVADHGNRRVRKITFSLSLPGPLPVCDATWHHIAISYSGSTSTNTLTAYTDGSEIASTTGTYSISSSTSSLRIGTNGNSDNQEYFTGSVSDIRVFSRFLSSNDISQIMLRPPTPTASASATASSQPSFSANPSCTSSPSATVSGSGTPSISSSSSIFSSMTSTTSSTSSATSTSSSTSSMTSSATSTSSTTSSATATPSSSMSSTSSSTSSATSTSSSTSSMTSSATSTSSTTSSATATPSSSSSPTSSATATSSPTSTSSSTASASSQGSLSPASTISASSSTSFTMTSSETTSPSPSSTVSATASGSMTVSSSASSSPTPSHTFSGTTSMTTSASTTLSPSNSVTTSPTVSSSSSVSPSTTTSSSVSASVTTSPSTLGSLSPYATSSSSATAFVSLSSVPSPSSESSASSSLSSFASVSGTFSSQASVTSAASMSGTLSSIASISAVGSSSGTLSSIASISAVGSSSGTLSSIASVTSTFSSMSTISSVATFTSTASSSSTSSGTASSTATSTGTVTGTSTRSGTTTATRKPIDLDSPSPSSRPIVNVAFSLGNVQLSLFTSNTDQSSTLSSLATAVSAAAGVQPSFVSIRRIRDMTFPLTPVVIWINPQFAGDVFPARRRLQGSSSSTTGSVGVDVQINVPNIAAASTLSSTLASSSTKLATDVYQSLVTQGSPLSSATISAKVEVFIVPTSSGDTAKASDSSNNSSSAYPAAMATVVVIAAVAIGILYYKLVKQTRSVIGIAPAPEDERPRNYESLTVKKSNDSLIPMSSEETVTAFPDSNTVTAISSSESESTTSPTKLFQSTATTPYEFKFCGGCGYKFEQGGHRFCPHCGTMRR